MPAGKITFSHLVQDSQDYGSDDDHMVSRVFFSFELSGKRFDNLYADIKQIVGGDFDTSPLEVSAPVGYKGPFNHAAFQKDVEAYYRRFVGRGGSGMKIGGARNIRMRNNTLGAVQVVEIEVSDAGGSW